MGGALHGGRPLFMKDVFIGVFAILWLLLLGTMSIAAIIWAIRIIGSIF